MQMYSDKFSKHSGDGDGSDMQDHREERDSIDAEIEFIEDSLPDSHT